MDTSITLKALLDNNVIDKQYKALINSTLAKKNILTISDILSMQDLYKYYGIGEKKIPQILRLQEEARLLMEGDINISYTNNIEDPIVVPSIVEQMAEFSITVIGRHIKCGDIPKSLQKIGVKTLKDLWCVNFDNMTLPSGFSKKKAEELQYKFKNLSQSQFEDILFWNTEYVMPSKYGSDITIEENLELVLDELIDYVDKCYKREAQISKQGDRNRVYYLQIILNEIYRNNKSRKDVATILKFKNNDPERVRQLLVLEFLQPLFNGEKLKYDVLKHISINPDLIERVANFRKNMIFHKYSITDGCSITFFEDVTGFDILQHNPLSYIVPIKEKGVYRNVIKAFIDEMGTIMTYTPLEDLENVIDSHEIIQREIHGKNKSYDKHFLEHLFLDDDMIMRNDTGILLKPDYIRNFGKDEIGNIIQERALARIIADANKAIHTSKIVDIYKERYGVELDDVVSIRRTQDYGCQCVAHGYWMYSKDELLSRPEFIKRFVRRETPFYLQDVIDALQENSYPVESEETIRMYVSQSNCAPHREKDKYFCHRDYIEKNGGNEQWITREKSGLNWMVNTIKLLFDQQGVNELDQMSIIRFLNDNIIGSPYEGRNEELKNHLMTYFGHRNDRPFNIIKAADGGWKLSKSDQYESTDWGGYGIRGNHSYHHYLVANAESIRRRMSSHPTLQELAAKLCEEKGDEVLGDEVIAAGEDTDRRRRIILKIRQQLETAISNNHLDHTLKIIRRDRNVYVGLDVRRVNAKKTNHYIPQNSSVQIEYKSISQLNELDWDKLMPILRSELSFCQKWMDEDNLGTTYNEVLDKFITFIKTDFNQNLSIIFPKRLYEFFAVSDPTSDDRYCTMCNIAKNFEALLDSIARRKCRIKVDKENPANGIFQKSQRYNFDDFTAVLDRDTMITDLRLDCYQRTLKYLNFVRNTDAHGQWYEDRYATDFLTEDQRNVQKILNFAALYIFTFAKYAMN